jgi:hypothetical protein
MELLRVLNIIRCYMLQDRSIQMPKMPKPPVTTPERSCDGSSASPQVPSPLRAPRQTLHATPLPPHARWLCERARAPPCAVDGGSKKNHSISLIKCYGSERVAARLGLDMDRVSSSPNPNKINFINYPGASRCVQLCRR